MDVSDYPLHRVEEAVGEQDDLAARLVPSVQKELMALRKGFGVADFDVDDYPLLAVMADRDKSKLRDMLRYCIRVNDAVRTSLTGNECANIDLLQSALNLDYEPGDPITDLTQRREAVAKKLGMSFRTVTRQEERGFKSLASIVVSHMATSDASLKARLREISARKSVPAKEWDGGDLRSVVRQQAREIAAMRDTLSRLDTQLVQIQAMNQYLSKLLGN